MLLSLGIVKHVRQIYYYIENKNDISLKLKCRLILENNTCYNKCTNRELLYDDWYTIHYCTNNIDCIFKNLIKQSKWMTKVYQPYNLVLNVLPGYPSTF